MAKLIGISGKKRVGKDTVARMIRKNAGRDFMSPVWARHFHTVAFADMLKRLCSEFSGIPLSSFYDGDLKEVQDPKYGMSPRVLMMAMHDVLKPNFGDDLFIRPVKDLWDKIESNPTTMMIVTDVRYENEAEWLRSAGGVVVHVSRPTGLESTHSSEQGIAFDFATDFALFNNGPTLDSLEEEVIKVIKVWELWTTRQTWNA